MPANHKLTRKEERKDKRRTKRPRQDSEKSDWDEQKHSDRRGSDKKGTLPKQQRKHDGGAGGGGYSKTRQQPQDNYSHLDPVVAAAMRRDDLEISRLHDQLGRDKRRLNREYATQEGFGDDFGDFLDDIDTMVRNVTNPPVDSHQYSPVLDRRTDDEDDMSEASVPMKPAAVFSDSDSNVQDIRTSSPTFDDDEDEVVDHGRGLTYRPVSGEDIYGKALDACSRASDKPAKYIPPHMRNKDSLGNEETLRNIQKSLNSSLNRLSEDTLVPVTQALVKVYDSYATSDVNQSLFRNLQAACVSRGQTMDGLIPIYVAAIAGVHYSKGDSAQLGEFVLERTVEALVSELDSASRPPSRPHHIENKKYGEEDGDDDEILGREITNLGLILCYLYNFGLAHCTLLYDMVRRCLTKFREAEVEVLLLLLRHCGRALRSDDPLALKEIVVLVQKQQSIGKDTSSSRGDYMVQTILDLKNNKRRKQDEVILDRTARLRKLLGHIKSNVDRKTSEPLRISLDDILNVESKGRWWKVGASWSGDATKHSTVDVSAPATSAQATQDMDPKLLKLAERYRMNTDTRRAIFCIVMGAEDYEDCFEKLVRAGMLKHRVERETVRIVMECCGNEKTYNKFYSHLAVRLCEYQPQSKFSFQLSFWDCFKQFEGMEARKAANLAKLLFNLVAIHNCMKLTVLKPLDMATPGDLCETAMIFLTVFFSGILDHFDDPSMAASLINNVRSCGRKTTKECDELDENAALQASLTVFLVQVMKESPKYKKGSRFRSNLKAAVKACDIDGL